MKDNPLYPDPHYPKYQDMGPQKDGDPIRVVEGVLPVDAKERKEVPIYSGVLKYFPDAIAAIAKVSYVGNSVHNPGEPLHWAREKSTDQEDCLIRHLLEAGTIDTDGQRHTAKVAWRALAMLQLEIERAQLTDPRGVEAGHVDAALSGVG
jgi:hypothetical protein